MSASADNGPQVFRPRRVFAVIMSGAVVLWLGVLLYLFQFDGVPAETILTGVFFVVFFAVSVTYYARTAVFVDARGVTFRGLVRTRRFEFSEIHGVQVMPGPITVYAVGVRERFVHFTSFFGQHRRLMKLLVDRAGLAPV